MTAEPTAAEIASRGPYLDCEAEDIILMVPDMGDEGWRQKLRDDGFLRLNDDLWCDIATPMADWNLQIWRRAFDEAFPGIRRKSTEEEARLSEAIRREQALPLERPYGSSRLFR